MVADRLALYVDAVYNAPERTTSAPSLLVATYFFAFQIYCDFSGYSDIAIGVAARLRLRADGELRHARTFASSITEFWRRWHISLSTWFRDYVYIPLGGNRVPAAVHLVNLLSCSC